MADVQIEELTELTEAPAADDLLVCVDVDDTTDDAGGTTKKILVSNALSKAASAVLVFTLGNGLEAITTGLKGFLRVPFDCTITKVSLLADQTGNIVIDIWKDTFANAPPTDDDSITASAPPTLSSADRSEDGTLTGWTTTISSEEVLAFNVDSVSTVTQVTVFLDVTKT